MESRKCDSLNIEIIAVKYFHLIHTFIVRNCTGSLPFTGYPTEILFFSFFLLNENVAPIQTNVTVRITVLQIWEALHLKEKVSRHSMCFVEASVSLFHTTPVMIRSTWCNVRCVRNNLLINFNNY